MLFLFVSLEIHRRRRVDFLKYILKQDGCGMDSSGSRNWPVVGSCKNGNEASGSIKGGEFLGSLSDYKLLKKGYAPWS
jgi:hypothetical protein